MSIKKIDSFLNDTKVEYIGIGCPGGVDPEQGIFYGSKELVVGKINFKKEFSKYIYTEGTPVTIFFKKGEEETTANRIQGNASSKKIEDTLKKYHFIK